jgi:hypothetical protein
MTFKPTGYGATDIQGTFKPKTFAIFATEWPLCETQTTSDKRQHNTKLMCIPTKKNVTSSRHGVR